MNYDSATLQALKSFLYRMADDSLIIAHRNSEWTGLGPILEEDIAFSSIAQDKLGHALSLYTLLNSLGEKEPDIIAFTRQAKDFTCCQFVEYPIGGYDFSLLRHFLYDTAELIRFTSLTSSTYEPLAKLSKKIIGEIKYHVFHANTWMVHLGAKGNEESHERMQTTLNRIFPLALGMFEEMTSDPLLISSGIYTGEQSIKHDWIETITAILTQAQLIIPHDITPIYGGRTGNHSEYLDPLLQEMTEVFSIDPLANW
jgi:ring-1,2-phenylacetyl-CoA epoxidase subunit PaaC